MTENNTRTYVVINFDSEDDNNNSATVTTRESEATALVFEGNVTDMRALYVFNREVTEEDVNRLKTSLYNTSEWVFRRSHLAATNNDND